MREINILIAEDEASGLDQIVGDIISPVLYGARLEVVDIEGESDWLGLVLNNQKEISFKLHYIENVESFDCSPVPHIDFAIVDSMMPLRKGERDNPLAGRELSHKIIKKHPTCYVLNVTKGESKKTGIVTEAINWSRLSTDKRLKLCFKVDLLRYDPLRKDDPSSPREEFRHQVKHWLKEEITYLSSTSKSHIIELFGNHSPLYPPAETSILDSGWTFANLFPIYYAMDLKERPSILYDFKSEFDFTCNLNDDLKGARWKGEITLKQLYFKYEVVSRITIEEKEHLKNEATDIIASHAIIDRGDEFIDIPSKIMPFKFKIGGSVIIPSKEQYLKIMLYRRVLLGLAMVFSGLKNIERRWAWVTTNISRGTPRAFWDDIPHNISCKEPTIRTVARLYSLNYDSRHSLLVQTSREEIVFLKNLLYEFQERTRNNDLSLQTSVNLEKAIHLIEDLES